MSEPGGASAAFFDVDETLVSLRTLESFLLFYLKRVPSMVAPERLRELAQQVTQLDRAEFNRLYFGLWAGQPVEQVRAAGRDWYREVSAQPGFFRADVLQRLREHRAAGARIVLVSGSFEAPLQPLADELAVDELFCTRLEIADGAYTGRIAAAMIGEDKRTAIGRYSAAHRPPVTRSWGYGDHPSDLPLLDGVTDPVVVGSDATMLEIAAERSWPVLAGDQPLAPRA
ncbi:HAD family hydrolase [Gryllotalpicola ginsengisoli]|uniref:HAD family hydrolase n=1 Tax=Gryllotalpicola ginsengisoli TaxID=444608 RepID=UPI0003B37506|nr:HAD-IB family hydrolase [Gryllotalpicola ginsengisoli]